MRSIQRLRRKPWMISWRLLTSGKSRSPRSTLKEARFYVQESIEYENILFTHDLAAVLDRIRQTPTENARRSKEIVDRGSAAEALVHSLWSIEKEATKRLALINELSDACQVRDKRIDDLTAGRISMDTTIATLRGLFGRKR
jgi:hypothetical protein